MLHSLCPLFLDRLHNPALIYKLGIRADDVSALVLFSEFDLTELTLFLLWLAFCGCNLGEILIRLYQRSVSLVQHNHKVKP